MSEKDNRNEGLHMKFTQLATKKPLLVVADYVCKSCCRLRKLATFFKVKSGPIKMGIDTIRDGVSES
jgi:hypothetical protein